MQRHTYETGVRQERADSADAELPVKDGGEGMPSDVWRRFDRPASCPLTRAEWEVMSGLAMGRSVLRVAEVCGKTPSTVRQQVLSAKRRLGVGTRAEAVLRVRQGWPRPDPRSRVLPQEPLSPVLKAYLEAFDERTREWRDTQLVDRKRLQMRLLLNSELLGNGIRVTRVDHRQRQQPSRLKYSLESDILPGL